MPRHLLLLLCCGAVAGCAHVSAPAGWDCRATVEGGGVRAKAWQHVDRDGRVELTLAEWWLQPPTQEIPRFGAVWDAHESALDWTKGRVELVYSLGAASPGQRRRLELYGDGRRLLHGAFDRAPNLLLTAPWQDFRTAAAARGVQLVVADEAARVVVRQPLDATLLDRGISMAVEALQTVTMKRRDFRNQCVEAPVIIPT